jgi:hypothetical protein
MTFPTSAKPVPAVESAVFDANSARESMIIPTPASGIATRARGGREPRSTEQRKPEQLLRERHRPQV